MNNIKRRTFLKLLATVPPATASVHWLQACSSGGGTPPARSRVVRITNPNATDGSGGLDNVNLNEAVVREMVASGIKKFSGRSSVEDAWAEIIPDPDARVAVKVNCQITEIYTKGNVVRAVVDGLTRRGVDPSNIVIYDLTDNAFAYAGLEKNLGPGVKVGTNEELGGYSWTSWFGNPVRYPRIRFCKVVAGQGRYGCDYIINIPVLKALDGYSGVSISMKNHFGSISNPGALHSTIQDSIAALNAHRLIRRKTRLILVDGIFAMYRFGGRNAEHQTADGRNQDYVTVTNQLLVGIDPVAIDSIGWRAIDTLRQRHNLEPVKPEPHYLQIAASRYGLGNADMQRIDIVDI